MISVFLGVRECGGSQCNLPHSHFESSGTWKEKTLNLGGSLQHFGLRYSGKSIGSMAQELDSFFEYECERVYSQGVQVCGVYKVA